MVMTPATTKSPPALFGQVSRAPKKRAARTITSATLSLSMGATRDAGPACSALGVLAALTAILAKLGVAALDANVAAIRTSVVVVLT